MAIAIRTVSTADAESVSALVTALGYPTSLTQMRKRLESILGDSDYATLVACDGEDVVGFIGTRVGPMYDGDGDYGQIMALSVAADHQRRGVGRMLMQAAESILVGHGVAEIIVTSGNQRAGAHAFYERNGYAFTGRRYKKRLASFA